MKWNVNHIVEFLKVYHQYPVLWNIQDKDYCNTKLKIEIFQSLFDELSEKQLTMGMDTKQLKSRIKSIKDVYRQELNKIIKSKQICGGTEEIYTPKLAWFNEASYLGEVLATRSSISNLDLSQCSQDSGLDENSEKESVPIENEKQAFKKSHEQMRPPATSLQRPKKRALDQSSSEISKRINHFDKIAKNIAEEKPYEQFGKFVASELRQLSQRQAILLQHEIQNCIIRSKLASLDQMVVDGALSSNHFLSSSNDDDEERRYSF